MPALVPLWAIFTYAVNTPYWDDWSENFVGLNVKFHEHRLAWHDFVHQHNEHRMVPAKLLGFALDQLTHGNLIAHLLAAWVLICLTSLGIRRLLRATLIDSSKCNASNRINSIWLICNILIFNPLQWNNWLWAVCLANVMPIFWIVGALVLVTSNCGRWTRLGGVVICCVAATFSFGCGMLAWPLASGVLLRRHPPRGRLRSAIVVAAAMLLTFGYYFVGYSRAGVYGFSSVNQWLRVGNYIACFMGNPFVASDDATAVAACFGIAQGVLLAGVIAYAVVRRRGGDSRLSGNLTIWIAVCLFSVGCAMIAAPMRAMYGDAQALESRYISFALYLAVGLVPAIYLIVEDLRQRTGSDRLRSIAPRLPLVFAMVLIAAELYAVPRSINEMSRWQTQRRLGRATTLLSNVIACDELITQRVFWSPAELRQRVRQLAEIGFLDPPPLLSDRLQPIDSGNAAPFFGRIEPSGEPGPVRKLRGWVGANSAARFPDAIIIAGADVRDEPRIKAFTPIKPPQMEMVDGQPPYRTYWIVALPADAAPQQRLTAWGLDAATANVWRLDGEIIAPSPPLTR